MMWEEILLKLFLALVLGSLLGLEREIRGISAGLRTHALLCLACTIFVSISTEITSANFYDITRIAAMIAAGVGFLCGGVIIKSQNKISGLTTAANLFLTAGVGTTIGLGIYLVGVLGTFFALAILFFGKIIEAKFIRPKIRLKK